MPWTFSPAFDAGHRAALQTGKSLVYVAPPAGWALHPLFGQLPAAGSEGVATLVLAPEPSATGAVARSLAALEPLAPVLPVGTVPRAARLLTAGRPRTVVADAGAALQLVQRTRLDLTSLERVVVLWPELHAALGDEEHLHTILAEARGVQRLVATGDPNAIPAFLERHAHRAPVLAAAPLSETPGGEVRFAVVEDTRVVSAVSAVLDRADPDTAFVWDPTDRAARLQARLAYDPTVRVSGGSAGSATSLVVATDLPSAEALDALRAVASDVVVLIRPWQREYLSRLAARCTPFRLPSAADAAEDQRRWMREELRARLASDPQTSNLLALAPLFDEFDPALVAAALLAGGTAPAAADADVATWVHLRLSVGDRDRVRTSDVVGALLNAVGLAKHQIGRVDVRESYSVVEVRAEAAEAARRGLDGTVLKGRSVSARFDRR